MSFPTTTIGGHTVSRLVCGSNSFLGFSHFSGARDAWLRRHFTVERMVEVMTKCSEHGINAIVSPVDQKIRDAIEQHDRATGRHMIWISTTYGSPEFPQQMKEIEQLGEWGAEICLIHCGYTDTHLRTADATVVGMEQLLVRIRQLGMIPGVSSHRPETIPTCDRASYDTEVYIMPLNVIGFLSNLETNWVSRLIQQTPKSVVSIKPLGAGRIMPREGLTYVYHSIKPIDTVAIGLLSTEEADEDIRIAHEILTGMEAGVELLSTPSKSTVAGG